MTEKTELQRSDAPTQKMKRFVVEQNGCLQIEASRRFVVEVPGDFTEEGVEELLERAGDSLPESEGMEWQGEDGRNWSGYEIEIDCTDVSDPDVMAGDPEADGMRIIRLDP